MNFWDSSALVTLLIHESSSERMLSVYRERPDILVWWASEVECVSVLSRLERESSDYAAPVEEGFKRLDTLKRSWNEVEPVVAVRETARRILRAYPLRASDALQLAAAVVSSEYRPSSIGFVCLDKRLLDAAKREGFDCIY
jgi:uncharacterized protein